MREKTQERREDDRRERREEPGTKIPSRAHPQ
jgi:hypothetical protein